jgi:uncharacterized protein
MGKIILWIVVIFAILFVVRMLSVAKARRDKQSANADTRHDKTPGPMVRCADCGVYLPKTDALPSPQGFGCGDPNCAHRTGASR